MSADFAWMNSPSKKCVFAKILDLIENDKEMSLMMALTNA
jgi:hypothetical protein